MPGQKITVRGRNGYFRVSEIDAIVFMDESAQISVYSSRHGKTPPVPVLSSILSIFSRGPVIRAMKAELYRNTVTEIAGFLKGEGYIVFPGELSLPCERSVPAPVNG
ncbi:MAG: hypothetical protein ACXWMC_10685 [Syntrophales bacterium]